MMIDRPERTVRGRVEECTVCGEPIAVNDWHIATIGQSTDDETEIHSFCSEGCRDTWKE